MSTKRGPKKQPLFYGCLLHMGDRERFWAQTHVTDECWIWYGAMSDTGYGTLQANGRSTLAHRYAYEMIIGPVPVGMTLDHLCRTPSCVNPEHLEPVTMRENILRGDSPSAREARQTHCIRGHPLSGDNLYVTSAGHRQCRACIRARQRRWRKNMWDKQDAAHNPAQ